MSDAPFWQAMRESRLSLPRCNACETWSWPPQPRCAACGSWTFAWQQIAPTARVHSYTRTWHGFTPRTKSLVPFVTILAELPQAGGARLLGTLTGPEDALAIGAPLTAEFAPPEAPDVLPTLLWRLAC